MARASQSFAGTHNAARNAPRGNSSATEESVLAHVPSPRPLQVTWEMTRSWGWKATPPRSAKATSRDRQQISTAEAFHLIEEVGAMHVPLLAHTAGDPLTRPD